MTVVDFVYLGLFAATLLVGTPLLGKWMAAVLRGEPPPWLKWLQPVERAIYRAAGLNPEREMTWRSYATALLVFHGLGFVGLLAVQLLQNRLPLNPVGLGPVPLGVAVNTAVSFVTNTNWQAYSGEASMSYLTQMTGLSVQNFLSASWGRDVMRGLCSGSCSRTSLQRFRSRYGASWHRQAGCDDWRWHERCAGTGAGRRRCGHEYRHAGRSRGWQHGRPRQQPH